MTTWNRTMASEDGWLHCGSCGAQLLDDPEDNPTGGADGSPICGECARNRDFETDMDMLDAEDGVIDGMIDW